MKKLTVKQEYDNLAEQTKAFVKLYLGRQTVHAFFYKPTEQKPEEHLNPEGRKQFNVIEVRELINHVMTAQQLGYITVLNANANQLSVLFVEREPTLPLTMQHL